MIKHNCYPMEKNSFNTIYTPIKTFFPFISLSDYPDLIKKIHPFVKDPYATVNRKHGIWGKQRKSNIFEKQAIFCICIKVYTIYYLINVDTP